MGYKYLTMAYVQFDMLIACYLPYLVICFCFILLACFHVHECYIQNIHCQHIPDINRTRGVLLAQLSSAINYLDDFNDHFSDRIGLSVP